MNDIKAMTRRLRHPALDAGSPPENKSLRVKPARIAVKGRFVKPLTAHVAGVRQAYTCDDEKGAL